MTTLNKGKYLEKLVQALEETLKPNSTYKITHDTKLKDQNGTYRQIDVLIEHEDRLGKSLIIIEVKNWNRKLKVSDVGQFLDLVSSVQATKGIMVSRLGAQKGAITKANAARDIFLYIIESSSIDDLSEWFKHGVYEIKYLPRYDKVNTQYNFTEKVPNCELKPETKIIINERNISLDELLNEGIASSLEFDFKSHIEGIIEKYGYDNIPFIHTLTETFIGPAKVFTISGVKTLLECRINIPVEITATKNTDILISEYKELDKDAHAQIITSNFKGYDYVAIKSTTKEASFIIPKDEKDSIIKLKKLE